MLELNRKVNSEVVHRPDFRTKSKKNRAPEWLLYDELEKRKDIAGNYKLVAKLLTSLIESSGGQHYAFESWIARTLGLSVRTVQRATKKLEAIGFLAIEHRGGGFSKDENGNSRGRANRYSLAGMHDTVSCTARQDDVRPHVRVADILISTNTIEILESQSNPLEREQASPPVRFLSVKEESEVEIQSKQTESEYMASAESVLGDDGPIPIPDDPDMMFSRVCHRVLEAKCSRGTLMNRLGVESRRGLMALYRDGMLRPSDIRAAAELAGLPKAEAERAAA